MNSKILNTISLLFLSIALLSTNALATQTWLERDAQDKLKFVLCKQRTWDEKAAQNCFNEIFYKRHTESYYGATMFVSTEDAVKERVLKLLKESLPKLPTWGYHAEIIKKVEEAKWLALAVVEEDMKVFHLYSISANAEDSLEARRLMNLSRDWFDQWKLFWGFPESSKTQDY